MVIIIFTAFLFTAGVALVGYSVSQSRKSLGYSIFLLVCAWAYFFWLVLSFLPEHFVSLAFANRRPENVCVHSVTTAELELGNIQ